SGLPFAAARAAAAETLCPGAADLLQTPNNILGIEYCKAILRQGAAMQLLPLPRLGAAHGTAQTGQVQGQALASASHIRQLVHTQGIKAASPFVPQAAMELYRQAAEQGQLADPEKFSTAVLTLLRTKTPEQLSTLRGAGEGLENRLYAAAREAETVNDLYDRLKTKRYPTARLRRLVLDAVLDVPAAGLPALPPYLLVLGAKRSALPLLKHAKIPAGTSLAGLAGQDQKLQIAADMHSKAVDFSLLCRYKIQPMGHAYTAHVVLL
ncbi:MAG: nucleotidyltransferase family protein, partial [Gemmiger qucibialis]